MSRRPAAAPTFRFSVHTGSTPVNNASRILTPGLVCRCWCCPARPAHAGVDMLVDVHGDEELPYCFIAGSEGIPGWSERMQLMQVCMCVFWGGAN